MNGLPEVTCVGTVVADPELRFIPSGDAVVNFTVASNSRRYDRETGQWVDGDTTFLRCSLWRQAAENVSESLTKGDRVIVTGQLKQRSYETQEGDKRTVFELAVAEVGPSLRWATAKISKADRKPSTQPGDAWTAQPARASDEPPF
ncbi:single-stranded DNA-binding protein [Saccharopolyspora indica]|uniref:single-stranded DNA-binding protein n=1 Tax=Saccharopolyspora indica TaxID=1229659 RepID=UPI0022EAB2E2|nr:single-stranded DNA-binding protein [Saccharopolyspora indica]MDA3644166.1 single-stranded DNA-binding protein [Saccharopolyspora indica]